MHILVTGAGGYIGSTLVPQLLETGHKVTALDRYFFGVNVLDSVAVNPRLKILRRDVRDITPNDLAGVDAICDLAAMSNDPSGDLNPNLTEDINLKARQRLGILARDAGVTRYVLSSSCSVYGSTNGELVDEAASPKPLTIYARCNVEAERALLELSGHDFAVTVMRNATVFGLSPRMRFDLVVNVMTLHAVRNARILVMGGGRQWRPLVHVRDVTRTITAALDAPSDRVRGKVFNCGVSNYQVRTLAYMVREELPFRIDVEIAPDDDDKRDYRVSFDRLADIIDVSTFLPPSHGVREIYAALRSGDLEDGPRTRTVSWYRSVMEAKKLVDEVSLNERLL